MLLVSVIWFSLTLNQSSSFTLTNGPIAHQRIRQDIRHHVLHSSKSPSFDLSKPTFDLFSMRSVRGDALLRYNSLNQSEPLRINLYALLALALFVFPSIRESIGMEYSNGDEIMGMAQTGLCFLGGVGSTGLFLRECQSRSNQLIRIEKELMAQGLMIRLPLNRWSPTNPYTDPVSLQGLSQVTDSPPRFIVISGTNKQLDSSLIFLSALGRRLRQANTWVIPIWKANSVVNVDDDDNDVCSLGKYKNGRYSWLAEAQDIPKWEQYFEALSSSSAATSSTDFAWFGLTSTGRSFGSGIGMAPQWLELMGQFLRPTASLYVTENIFGAEETQDILDVQSLFYEALTQGDNIQMASIWSSDQSSQVSQVIQSGGRLDNWDACLQEDARPMGMKISDRDAVLLSETSAYTTAIEFPRTPSDAMSTTPTLLAVQQWSRSTHQDSWKLVLHQTIPWTVDQKAFGTLRCDCRGCVALTRTNDKRTFGGLIG
jgi:hypothetical protein